jgi:predicted regulator of Ras-like GTPase activity (Roadblock/LC7/MglB family)
VSNESPPSLVALEKHVKDIVNILAAMHAATFNAAQALSGIHAALSDANVARDGWAREIATVLGAAKEEGEET